MNQNFWEAPRSKIHSVALNNWSRNPSRMDLSLYNYLSLEDLSEEGDYTTQLIICKHLLDFPLSPILFSPGRGPQTCSLIVIGSCSLNVVCSIQCPVPRFPCIKRSLSISFQFSLSPPPFMLSLQNENFGVCNIPFKLYPFPFHRHRDSCVQIFSGEITLRRWTYQELYPSSRTKKVSIANGRSRHFVPTP